MANVRLCDCIKCVPDSSDENCLRCVDEQYEYLINTVDDSVDVDDSWLYDDEDYVESWFNWD